MKTIYLVLLCLVSLSAATFAQTKPKSVEDEKFVFLNNGATVGMVVKSVLKADKQRLKLTDQQMLPARDVIINATVKYNEGVKKLKAAKSMTQQKLRSLAVAVEDEKVRNYKAVLTPEQYTKLVSQHKKVYPESKV
jgi:capsular polysaccharide biosynthesis protein